MSEDRFESFEEFWGHYLAQHSKPTTRLLHAAGAGGAVASAIAALVKKEPKYLALVPILGFGPAWLSHLFIEGNKPTAFEHPIWSLEGDLKMFKMMATGEIEEEIKRLVDDRAAGKQLIEALQEAERMSG